MKRIFTVLLAGALGAPAIAHAEPKDIRPICQAFVDAWRNAYNKGDAAALAGMYEATSGSYSSAFWTASGRAALTQAFGQELSRGGQMTAITCDDAKQIEDIGISEGTYSATAPGPEGKSTTMQGHWMATVIQRGRNYFILAHNANLQIPTQSR